MEEDSCENFNDGVMQYMSSKQKLELTWIGKEKRQCLEPSILVEDSTKSYHAKTRHGDNDIFDNMLIHGDNLLALKALEHDFAGQVKCIYIDPPYNTKSAFSHYDDFLQHSIWLGLMKERLELLYHLLSEKGSIWISIDDQEQAYLKVLCDEIFGRNNFVSTVIWEKKYSPQNDAKWLSDSHDFILVYAKNKNLWRPHLLPRTEAMNNRYKNPDNDPRGPWKPGDLLRKDVQKSGLFTITTPCGRICNPPAGRSWRVTEKRYEEMVRDNRIWFGKKGDAIPAIKRFLSEVQDGAVCKTIWTREEVGDNDSAQKEQRQLFPEDPFETPKPESLIARIILLSTEPGDLVLDSFLGSGTTMAVAHKMGRKWIGIELGEHCNTLCIPRLSRVINGEDSTGVSKKYEWHGGGGFRFYELGESLIKLDQWGQPIIDKLFNAGMLAQSVCKLEGFEYAPSQDEYFIHGHSTEHDFIYVTTNFMRQDHLDSISQSVGTDRTLLICCKGFEEGCKFGNLTMKKIPKEVLDKCEWGKDDYSLNVAKLPKSATVPVQAELF